MRRPVWLVALLLFAAPWPAAAGTTSEQRVSAAIVAAVQRRMGADTEVIVERLEILTVGDITTVDAAADPAARLGGLVRFALTTEGRRAGHADAQLRIVATRARTVRSLPRGTTLGEGDLEDVRDAIADGPLRPLPTAAALIGGRVVRDLTVGAAIASGSVVAPVAVRTGQTVTAVMRASGIEASASMVAADSGNPGSIIRVVNRETRRALRARIVSAEIVEIIHD